MRQRYLHTGILPLGMTLILICLAGVSLHGEEVINIDEPDTGREKSSPSMTIDEPTPSIKTEEGKEEKGKKKKKSGWNFEIRGFAEFENFFSTRKEQDPEEIWRKREVRNRLEMKYGTSTMFFFLENNIYVNLLQENRAHSRYSQDFELGRNLRLSTPSSEIRFRQFYFNYEYKFFRLRVGNQVHAWGTADVFNPTNYFNPYDLREFLMKDDGELTIGMPSVSFMFMIGKHTLELVVAPLHVPALLPERGSFWEIQYREGVFPVEVQGDGALPLALKNIAAGLRYYVNVGGFDLNASLYYGPAIDPLVRPAGTVARPNEPVAIAVEPTYKPTVMIGFAGSKSVQKFVFQLEVAYSPWKWGVVDQDIDSGIPELPFEMKPNHYLAYSAGVNWFMPLSSWISEYKGESIITLEWTQSINFNRELMKPLLTDLITTRLDFSFIEDRLKTSITGVVDVSNGSFLIQPEVSYRFRFNMKIWASYLFIMSKPESFLGYYDQHDVATVGVRYEY